MRCSTVSRRWCWCSYDAGDGRSGWERPACGPGCLGAFALGLGDGGGGRVYAELGFQVREAVSDCVQVEGQFPRDVRLFLDRGGGTEHFGLAWGQAEAIECVLAEGRDVLFQQQRVRVAGQQVDGEAPSVSFADERRPRWQSEPLSDGLG